MKLWIPALLAVAALGCQSQPKPASSTAVLDVSAPPPSYQPSAYPPPAVTPAYAAAPAPEPIPAAVIETPAPAPQVSASDGARYTVRRGDTLYRIARERYGDGKQWRRIAAANPGVSPTTLKVGQVLVMP